MASEKITAMIDEIKALSVLELKELVDEICETFGVSAVAAAAPAAGGAVEAAAEKTEFDVVMTGFGDQKIKVITEIRGPARGRRRNRRDKVIYYLNIKNRRPCVCGFPFFYRCNASNNLYCVSPTGRLLPLLAKMTRFDGGVIQYASAIKTTANLTGRAPAVSTI